MSMDDMARNRVANQKAKPSSLSPTPGQTQREITCGMCGEKIMVASSSVPPAGLSEEDYRLLLHAAKATNLPIELQAKLARLASAPEAEQ